MSKTATEIGMIAGGIALALAAGPIGIMVFQSLAITNALIGIGLTTAVAGTAGLLNPGPLDPSNIGPQGQLAVQSPNPLWRVIYGIFQFAGAISFIDGPILNWQGTGSGTVCNNQFVHRVHTLACHQIAGFLAVVLDGQTFNFGTDLVLLTTANNNGGQAGPPGLWAFLSNANPWSGQILFEFDCGDPGNATQPFPFLLAGATVAGVQIPIGSPRWTASCLQRGRAKVHVLIHYVSANNSAPWGPLGGAPQPYVLGSGRIPVIEFKIAGRIILDYRVVTAWLPGATYPQYSYVLATALGAPAIFVQQNSSGVSAGAAPNFSLVGAGQTVADGSCLWLNCGPANYAAGSGFTGLNNPLSNKLGGPGGTMLIADAWQGNAITQLNQVFEAPIGWLQQVTVAGETGSNRPNFATALGGVQTDGAATWTCLGRSKYATCLPDNDGTANQGGFSNPALVVADYLQTPKNQFGLGAALTIDSIDSVIAAANICDEPVVIEVF